MAYQQSDSRIGTCQCCNKHKCLYDFEFVEDGMNYSFNDTCKECFNEIYQTKDYKI